ncbi:MAG: DNA polymerase III subunit chi [Candidatus Protochlamydia sp.]|nr:DNA polymerase III subunit chi [Candidatus Protochlamydia sp.]
MNQARVIFFKIKDNREKVQFICTKAEEAYRQEKKLLILVPTEEAGQYVDSLLWRLPESSFLPHLLSKSPANEWIIITTLAENLNQAPRLLNLSAEASKILHFEDIYEIFDETAPDKLQASKEKIASYQASGINPILPF